VESNSLTERMDQVLRLQEYLSGHPYAVLIVAAALLAILVAVTSAMKKDPDAPIVNRRRVGAGAMVRFVKSAGRRGNPRRAFKRHVWPILGRLYTGEFVTIFGGPGIGKTMRVLVPLIAWRILQRLYSVVVLDPKGEIFDATIRLCGKLGGRPKVCLYSTLRKHRDSLVSAIDPFVDPTSRANFLEAILPDPPGEDPTWARRARRMLRETSDGLNRAGRRFDLVATYDVLKDPRALDELAKLDRAVAGVWAGQDNKTHESARTEALSPLEGLEDPRIRRVFDGSRMDEDGACGPDFGERTIVYLCVGPDDAGRAGALYAGLIDYLQRRAAYREEGPPVNFLIEEAGSYFTVEKLDEYINLGRGAGVNVLLVLQNYDQLKGRLGQHAAASIVGAMDVLLFGRTRNVATAQLLQELSGTVRVQREAPRAQLSFFDYFMGNVRTQERRRIEEERARVRAQHLYTLSDGQLFVIGNPNVIELVKAKRALWYRYVKKLMPKGFNASELRLALPSTTSEKGSEAQNRASDPAPTIIACPACSHENSADAGHCTGCGIAV
jgi:type IV secretory pathway TraG/TraD family ATPase VirD4